MSKPKLCLALVILIGASLVLALWPAQVTAMNVIYPKGNPGIWVGNAWIHCDNLTQGHNVSILGQNPCVGHQGQTCHFTLNTWAYYQTNNFGKLLGWADANNLQYLGRLRERYTMIGNCLNYTEDHPL